MTMNPEPIDVPALVELLQTGTPARPLSDAERLALLASLAELAAAESTIARQSMLLASYEEDLAAIERESRRALDLAGEALAGSPLAGFDHAKAETARTELIAAVRRSGTVQAVAGAALSFALRMAGLPIRV